MTLELFGWILMALGLVLFVYGYLKASKRLDVEKRMSRPVYYRGGRAPRPDHPPTRGHRRDMWCHEPYGPSPCYCSRAWREVPRVTEQEKREALRVVSRVRLYDWAARPDFNDPWGEL